MRSTGLRRHFPASLVMLLGGADSIRDVIPFPKTQKAQCPMTEAPSPVSPEQLKELHIKLDKIE